MRAIEAVTAKGETSALCQSIGVSRAPSPRALVPAERRAVRDTLHSARFVDQSPAEVYATLLEEQTYLCSPRTMYRVLAEADEVRERRDQVRHPAYVKPELVATAPNQVWSWDITKLKGPVPYLYYSLYVILDLFSRYVVGWMVAVKESAHLAERLIEQTCAKQRIQPQQLTIHADRGAPMRSKLVALLFSDLGIAASHARPRVSNDNPFSAAQFRTFKYRPAFPKRFGALEHARAICHDLLAWYNDAHHHSGLSYLTPAAVHYGRAPATLDLRHRTRLGAYAAHPERFVTGPPRPETLPTAVWINPPSKTTRQDAPGPTTGTPDDSQHAVVARPRPPLESVVVAPRRWRGVATVNAEPGCLKDVDTARLALHRLARVGISACANTSRFTAISPTRFSAQVNGTLVPALWRRASTRSVGSRRQVARQSDGEPDSLLSTVRGGASDRGLGEYRPNARLPLRGVTLPELRLV